MRKYVAEFIGTAVLVFFGCGSAVAANALFGAMGMLPQAFTTLLIAVAFGLTIVAMAYSIGNISGCHINPAVSLGVLISGKMSVVDFIGYVIAQILGAIAASAILGFIIKGYTTLGANGYGDSSTFGISMTTAIVVEVILTFVFVMVVLGVTDKEEYSSVAGLVIGFSLTLVHIFGVPFTGTSVNPARSIGPALIQWIIGGDATAVTQLWVFIVAPLLGAVIAALVYMFLKGGKDSSEVYELDEVEEEEEVEVEIPEIEPSER